jgi:hypothetical protein
MLQSSSIFPPMTWYTGDKTYDTLLASALAFATFVFIISWFVPSPYGKLSSTKYGISVSGRLGWFLMELPATLSFWWFFLHGPYRANLVPLIFGAMWLIHYGNRGFYFPFSIRAAKGATSNFSFMVIGIGWCVTSLHGYFHASYFTRLHRLLHLVRADVALGLDHPQSAHEGRGRVRREAISHSDGRPLPLADEPELHDGARRLGGVRRVHVVARRRVHPLGQLGQLGAARLRDAEVVPREVPGLPARAQDPHPVRPVIS